MKTIQVNQDELVKYIVGNCPHYFYNFKRASAAAARSRKRPASCTYFRTIFIVRLTARD